MSTVTKKSFPDKIKKKTTTLNKLIMKTRCPHCNEEITITLFVNREVPKTEDLPKDNPTLRSIAEIVCNNAGIPLNEFRSTKRLRVLAKARQQYYWLCKKFSSDTTLLEIGQFVRKELDHSTVIHGINTINDLMESSSQEMREMEFLIDRVTEKLLLNKAS